MQDFKRQVKAYLDKYNSYIVSLGSDYNLELDTKYYIPNNNEKLYCIILNNTMYFFSNKGRDYDFYIKLRGVFREDLLIEGYLYGNKYLVTDLLMINGDIVTLSFIERYDMLFKLDYSKLDNLNNKLTISLHEIYTELPTGISMGLSRRYVETVGYSTKINSLYKSDKGTGTDMDTDIEEMKMITKGKYSDVYNVGNIQTNNQEGILYIKTIQISKNMREFFEKEEYALIKCKWNHTFNKFYPV